MKNKKTFVLRPFAKRVWEQRNSSLKNGKDVTLQKLGGIARMTEAREKAQALVSAEELARYKTLVQDSLSQLEHALNDDNEDTLGTFGTAAWNYFHLLQAQYDFVREEHSVTHTGDPRVLALSKRRRREAAKHIEEYRAELECLVENNRLD